MKQRGKLIIRLLISAIYTTELECSSQEMNKGEKVKEERRRERPREAKKKPLYDPAVALYLVSVRLSFSF